MSARRRVLLRPEGTDDPFAATPVRKRPLPPKAPPRDWPALARCANPHCPHGWHLAASAAAPDVCRCGATRPLAPAPGAP